MKKIYTLIGCFGIITVSAFGQGQVTVQNYLGAANAANAIVSDITGSSTAVVGGTYLVDLLYGASSSTINNDAGLALTFHTGTGAGYWNTASTTLAGYTGTVWFQVEVWQAAAGASWAVATGGGLFNNAAMRAAYAGHGGTEYGASTVFSLSGVSGTAPTSIAQGIGTLQAFRLVPTVVPEPATLALAALGGASLLMFRRKK